MTSPFSPNYVSAQKGLDKDIRDAKMSTIRTTQRKQGLSSDDPDVRKLASGTLPGAPLSKRGGRKA